MSPDLSAALPDRVHWTASPTPADLSSLPGCAAVYLLSTADGRPVQLASTQHLRRAITARLTQPADSPHRRADLTELVRTVAWHPVACPFEARWQYYRLARTLYPDRYRQLIAFGPAWFLHVDWSRPISEIRVTERIWQLPGNFIGPWPTQRSCQQALEGLCDLFDLCRYPEQVRKAPTGTRCSYADMGRCDAPCDGSVPLAPYTARCRAAWSFASTGVEPWIADATERMKSAAAREQFELAGQIKQQLAFTRSWADHWSPLVRPHDQLRLLLALPATRRKAWKLFAFRLGDLLDGPIIPTRKLESGIAEWLRSLANARDAEIASANPNPPRQGVGCALLSPEIRMEQTWLLSHLLGHRERQSAVIIPLPDPPDADAIAKIVVSQAQRYTAKNEPEIVDS